MKRLFLAAVVSSVLLTWAGCSDGSPDKGASVPEAEDGSPAAAGAMDPAAPAPRQDPEPADPPGGGTSRVDPEPADPPDE